VPNWKVNVFISTAQAGNAAGWSETFYVVTDQVVQAEAKVNSYLSARNRLLAGDVSIQAFRISDDAVQGDSELEVPNRIATQKLGGDESTCDYTFAAYLMRLQAGLNYRRPLYLRGFPDEVTRPGGNVGVAIQQQFDRNMVLFVAALQNNGFYIKVISKEPAQSRVNILALSRSAPGVEQIQIQTSAPIPGAAVNGLIKIYGAAGVPGTGSFSGSELRGTQLVTAIAGNTYTLAFTATDFTGWNRKGTAKALVYVFKEITKAVPLRFTHRPSGRPFGAPVGRRPARR